MRLSSLLPDLGVDHDVEVTSITEDSRRVTPGAVFVAIAGHADDGHGYIGDAVRRGAAVVISERGDAGGADGAVHVRVADARSALAAMAARFYGNRAGELRLIGFTGTFGKTSTSDVLRALLASAGEPAGVVGSLGARYRDFHQGTNGLTTPAPVELHRALAGLAGAGARTVILEVTSHALRMRRAEGLTFSGGLLAAIQPGEHTDFHRTFEDYLDAKRLFLRYLRDDAILAYDADNAGARQLVSSRAGGRSIGFSIDGRGADLMFRDVALDDRGARFGIEGPLAGGRHQLRSALLGSGHLRNVALALTYALASGLDAAGAAAVLEQLRPLPRRMERYTIAGRTVLDDTAAHPDSIRMTFAVAALLPRRRLAAIYAIRGSRGADINARNAGALADLAAEHGIDELIVTASADAAGPADRVAPPELAAVEGELARRGRSFTYCEALRDAAGRALERTAPGDLVVLVGAQGMNRGRLTIAEAAGEDAQPGA